MFSQIICFLPTYLIPVDNMIHLLILLSFWIPYGSAFAADCNGVVVPNRVDLEKNLSFSRPAIAKDYSGHVGFFEVINEDGESISNFNEDELRKRILQFSSEECAPKNVIYPDIRLVIENYEKGSITSKIEYENGAKIHTKTSIYQPAGKLFSVVPIKDANIQGTVKYYHPDGKLNYELNFNHGKRDGCFESHYENGNSKETGCFREDKLIGEFKHYFENGMVELTAFFAAQGNIDGE